MAGTGKRKQRPAVDNGHSAALLMVWRLDVIRREYDGVKAAGKARTDSMKREAIRQSLGAVIDFVRSQGNGTEAALLFKMHRALKEVERGRGHTISWLHKAGRRPPVALNILRLRKLASEEMARLIREKGLTPQEAGRRVLRGIPKGSSLLAGVSNPTWKTVRRWGYEID